MNRACPLLLGLVVALACADQRQESDPDRSASTPAPANEAPARAPGTLRILAYNLVQHLRKCHVKAWRPRLGKQQPETWSTIFALVEASIVLWLLDTHDRAPPEEVKLATVVYPSTYLRRA